MELNSHKSYLLIIHPSTVVGDIPINMSIYHYDHTICSFSHPSYLLDSFDEVLIENTLFKEIKDDIPEQAKAFVSPIKLKYVKQNTKKNLSVIFLASTDTNVRLLKPIAKTYKDVLFVVPHRKHKNEGAISTLKEYEFEYVEIENNQLQCSVLEKFDPDIVITVADWTTEFFALERILNYKNIPFIGIQEGPHDFNAYVPFDTTPPSIWKLNQYRYVDVFFAQGAAHIETAEFQQFSVTGNSKIKYLDCPLPKEPKAFVNLNFTYEATKPPYEKQRDKWLSGVLGAIQKTEYDYLISQHPRDTAKISDDNLRSSHSGIVSDQIKECSIIISRLSSILYEALALGRRAVYYNPHNEPLPLFNKVDNGGIEIAENWSNLVNILEQHRSDMKSHQSAIPECLSRHCGPMDNNDENRISQTLYKMGTQTLDINAHFTLTQRQNSDTRKRVAICCRMPRSSYSGGRYNAWVLAEAIADSNHETMIISDNLPIYYNDFKRYPRHRTVEICLTKDFKQNMPSGYFDVIIMVPGLESKSDDYKAVSKFAEETAAKLVLFNFETPNWFNSLSPYKRDRELWNNWAAIASQSAGILCNSQESEKYAREFYKNRHSNALIDYAWPAINSSAADRVDVKHKENRIIMIARPQLASHKGSNRIADIISPAFKDHTLVLICGAGELPSNQVNQIQDKLDAVGGKLEFKFALNDVEKFREIKRAKILLFPSLFEGYGYPPIEAIYCETPCVAFELPVLKETTNGFVIFAEHNNWDDFKEKVSATLLNSPSLKGGKNHALKIASVQSCGKKVSEFLQKLPEIKVNNSKIDWSGVVDDTESVNWIVEDNWITTEITTAISSKEQTDKKIDNIKRILLVSIVPPFPDDQGNRLATRNLIQHYIELGYHVDLLLQGGADFRSIISTFGNKVRTFAIQMPDWKSHATYATKIKRLKALKKFYYSNPGLPKEQFSDLHKKIMTFSPNFIYRHELSDLAVKLFNQYNYEGIICNYIQTLKVANDLRGKGFNLPKVGVMTHDAQSQINFEVDGLELDPTFRYCPPEQEAEYLSSADVVAAITSVEKEYFQSIGTNSNIVLMEYDAYEEVKTDQISIENFHNKIVFLCASNNPMNVHGLREFLYKSWPQISARYPTAKFIVCGTVCNADKFWGRNASFLGKVSRERLLQEMSKATVAINPAVAGTGLKIKSVEYLCMGLPFVTLENGLDGLTEFNQNGADSVNTFNEMASSVIDLLDNYERWQNYHISAINGASKRFTKTSLYNEFDQAMSLTRVEDYELEIYTDHQSTEDVDGRDIKNKWFHDPSNPEILFDLAKTFIQECKIVEACEILRRCVVYKPDHWEANILFARLLIEKDEFTEALEPLTRYIGHYPMEAFPRALLARALFETSELSRAYEVIETALLLDSSNQTVLQVFSKIAHALKNPEKLELLHSLLYKDTQE